MPPASAPPAEEKEALRRDVTVWGSFMWGYADVGADIYTALGLVAAAAAGGLPVAFAVAGLIYVMVGLGYTELASTYPVAGGGQYFTLRGLGDIWGFVAGSALLLDYTIDIALFAVSSSGYFNFFLPYLGIDKDRFVVSFGLVHNLNYLWLVETVGMIIALILLNVRGIRISSLVNEVLGVFALLGQAVILVMGFLFAWDPQRLVSQMVLHFPNLHNFMYGSSLAIISFVGLESISQAAQETRRPATIIPRTSIALVLNVLIFAVSFAVLGTGFHSPVTVQLLGEHPGDPIAYLAQYIPVIGPIAAPFTALIGGLIVFMSSNSGVMSASRLTFSMSGLKLLPAWFNAVHPKFHTPHRTIVVFSLVAIVETILAFMTTSAMDLLGNMYAFGATLGYILVFISLIVLRFRDPYTPRPYRMPLNIRLRLKKYTHAVDFPILGIIGAAGVGMILFEVILTHAVGRIAGPAWVILLTLYYINYRKKQGMPIWGNLPRDWENDQRQVLASAEEFELLEAYEEALKERDAERARRAAGTT